MKKFICLILLIPFISLAQKSNTSDALKLCAAMQSNSFTSDEDAVDAVDKIFTVIGASQKPILQACSNINNAVAAVYKGQRYILYDREFMNSLSNGTSKYWTNMFILAHEVGHHINGHSLDIVLYANDIIDPKTLEEKRKQELEADEFAGFVLGKLGSSLSQIEKVLSNLPSIANEKTSTHPSKNKRIQAVRNGYNKTIVKYDGNKTIVKSDVSKSKSINTLPPQKGRNIPNLLNPRDREFRKYGEWVTANKWDFENLNVNMEDPFEVDKLKKFYSIRHQYSSTKGIKIGAEKQIPGVIEINQVQYFKGYNEWVNAEGRVASITLDITENIPVMIKNDFRYCSGKYDEIQNDYDNEYRRYLVEESEYVVPKSYQEDFISLYPSAVFISDLEISRNIFLEENGPEFFGVFKYIIDNKHTGELITPMSGYYGDNYGTKSWPDLTNQKNESGCKKTRYHLPHEVSKEEFEEFNIDNYISLRSQRYFLGNWDTFEETKEFIDLLKKGNKLYLRFDKLIKWNGYLENGKIDTSIEDTRFYIKPYTYEFDLSGSSKALKF